MSTESAPGPAHETDAPSTEPSTTDGNAELKLTQRDLMKWKKQARDAAEEIERLKAASATDAEKAIAAAKLEGASEFRTKWARAQVQNAALTILSRKGVTATELALGALDVSGLDIDDNGHVDTKDLEARVDDVIKRYPILTSSTTAQPGPFASGGDQRRVTDTQLASIKDKDELNKQLRWALGGGGSD
jgi:hypothetical protein